MSTLLNLKRLTVYLPEANSTPAEGELSATLTCNLKREAWHFVKETYGVALTQTPDSIFFTLPTGVSTEEVKQTVTQFVNFRWSVALPEITTSVDLVDDNGYLV